MCLASGEDFTSRGSRLYRTVVQLPRQASFHRLGKKGKKKKMIITIIMQPSFLFLPFFSLKAELANVVEHSLPQFKLRLG